jgi:hypothetical protein
VPVEFLAAQIEYVTSAENPELLPMLEVTVMNASVVDGGEHAVEGARR